jgi:anti-sigma factor RsiW
MSGDLEHPAQCEEIADELTELALGTLSGPRRSEVLDHVGSCQQCRAELEQLSIVVEALQQLAPQMQPPLGFELRLAERLQANVTPRTRRHRRFGVLAGVAASGRARLCPRHTACSRAGNRIDESVGTDVATANFTSDGKVVGDLFVAAGSPAWVFVTIHDGGWKGMVTCDVTFSGGHVETVGKFKLSGEYGSWAVPLPPNRQVRSAQLVASNGTVVASAELET